MDQPTAWYDQPCRHRSEPASVCEDCGEKVRRLNPDGLHGPWICDDCLMAKDYEAEEFQRMEDPDYDFRFQGFQLRVEPMVRLIWKDGPRFQDR